MHARYWVRDVDQAREARRHGFVTQLCRTTVSLNCVTQRGGDAGAAAPPPASCAAAVVRGAAPVAIERISTAVAAVSACVPGRAPLACRMYAVRLRYNSSSKRRSGGGKPPTASRMRVYRAFVVRAPHFVMNGAKAELAPASGGILPP